jgi:hypothetical protein
MKNTQLLEILKHSDDVTADAVWAILRYKNIGILRKVMCICKVLNLQPENVLRNLPKDENGRYLDKPTRGMIHEALIQRQNEYSTKVEQ